jgi:hypothetical protein
LLAIKKRIERAEEHIRDFEIRSRAFRDTRPYRLRFDRHPQASHGVYRIQIISEPPVILSLAAGEAIHQLRCSLDHLAWQLVEANGEFPGKHTYFPICSTLARYKSESIAKIRGMHVGATMLIDALKPYRGGNDDLWKLNELDNVNKRRQLPLVAFLVRDALVPRLVSAASVRVNIPHHEAWGDRFPMVKDGTAAMRVIGDHPDDADKELDIDFDIAFGVSQIVEGEPVIPCLRHFVEVVEAVVDRFVTYL